MLSGNFYEIDYYNLKSYFQLSLSNSHLLSVVFQNVMQIIHIKNILLIILSLTVISCTNNKSPGGINMDIKISSSAFEEGSLIPKKHTCDDADISPPLEWSGIPEGTKEIALICDDPDAPMGTWVHWVVYNLPANTIKLPESIPAIKVLENGTTQGSNDFHKIGYGGPCPPGGTHRYFFKIYALDVTLNLAPGKTKAELLEAMKGHILGEGQLMGKYKR